MKIFIDTANLDEIKKATSYGIVAGVTTNPSLIAKENKEKTFEQIIKEITEVVDGPISAEVISLEADKMVEKFNRSRGRVEKIPESNKKAKIWEMS